jgi:hypothetical protein
MSSDTSNTSSRQPITTNSWDKDVDVFIKRPKDVMQDIYSKKDHFQKAKPQGIRIFPVIRTSVMSSSDTYHMHHPDNK